MKKIFFVSFMLITSVSFAQKILIDTISIVKPDAQEAILDGSITSKLEPFKDKDDAVIYIYRLKAMAGSMVKWKIQVDSNDVVKLSQKEYVVAHINTTEKSHYITYPNLKYNYVNFKSNKYYMVRLVGFSLNTGYLDEKAFSEITSCKRIDALTK